MNEEQKEVCSGALSVNKGLGRVCSSRASSGSRNLRCLAVILYVKGSSWLPLASLAQFTEQLKEFGMSAFLRICVAVQVEKKIQVVRPAIY